MRLLDRQFGSLLRPAPSNKKFKIRGKTSFQRTRIPSLGKKVAEELALW